MRRVRCVVQYDGSGYFGFQRLPNRPTVQEALETAFSRVCREEIRIVGAGRTDAGVHAVGQVIHLDLTAPIPLDRLEMAVNRCCDRALRVLKLEAVSSEFHARFSARRRTYHYWFSRSLPSPFLRSYVTPISGLRADAGERMQSALELLLGRHDFFSLSTETVGEENGSTVRTLHRVGVVEQGALLRIELTADAFLRSMVRVIAGWLAEIACGNREPQDLGRALCGELGKGAVRTAPPGGLFLAKVGYPDGYPGELPGFEPVIGRNAAVDYGTDLTAFDCSWGEL